MLNRIAAVLIIVGGALFVTPIKAEEFGNVFSGLEEIESASRQASTEALDGIISVLNGIRQRESGEGNGVEAVISAADSFFSAGSQMKDILGKEGFPNFELSADHRGVLKQSLSRYNEYEEFGISKIGNFRNLFEEFGRQTSRMGSLAKEATGVGENERMFAKVSRQLQWYFAFADVVSAISESAPK